MNHCKISPWKLSICVLLSLVYLGTFIGFLKGPFSEDNHPVDINSLPRSEVKLNISTPIFTSNSLSTSNKTWKGTPARKTLPEIINKLIYGVSNTSTDTRTSLTHSHAKIVLIIAYMRSGSSFLGGMFNQYPESFYLFEPIRFIFEAIHDSKPVEYLSGRKRIFSTTDPEKTVILQDINKWLTCKLSEIDLDSLIDPFHFYKTAAMKQFVTCAKQSVLELKRMRSEANYTSEVGKILDRHRQRVKTRSMQTLKACLARATDACKEASVNVIKFIRINMSYLLELLPLYPNMKVIYLQRDPRGILQSRKNSWLLPDSNFQANADSHCERVRSDLEHLKNLQQLYPGRITPVLYEDLAENPLEVSEQLFRFCELNFSEETQKYIKSTTSLGGRDTCAFCVERGNSTKTAYKWRNKISLRDVLYIDRQCSSTYKTLGYERLYTLADIRNFSKPTRRKEVNIYHSLG